MCYPLNLYICVDIQVKDRETAGECAEKFKTLTNKRQKQRKIRRYRPKILISTNSQLHKPTRDCRQNQAGLCSRVSYLSLHFIKDKTAAMFFRIWKSRVKLKVGPVSFIPSGTGSVCAFMFQKSDIFWAAGCMKEIYNLTGIKKRNPLYRNVLDKIAAKNI